MPRYTPGIAIETAVKLSLFSYATPWGPISGAYSDIGLRSLLLPAPQHAVTPAEAPAPPEVAMALDRYFAGATEAFDAIPLDRSGATEFTIAVWSAARQVTWGNTSTYGALATRVAGSATHARAVGRALGANPLHILVPCHRFIAKDGNLVNFAAGLEWKRRLLQLEGSLML